jgi:hypothetical protein
VELGGRPLITSDKGETIVFTSLWHEDALFYLGVLIEIGEGVFLYRDVVGEFGEDESRQRGLVNQPHTIPIQGTIEPNTQLIWSE